MSTIRKIEAKLGSKKYKVNVESYASAEEVVNDCRNRKFNDSRYDTDDMDMQRKKLRMEFHHVKSYDEALDFLKLGYQPTVEKLGSVMKCNKVGIGKRIAFENNVHGFAPIVPLALKGVPNSMVNTTMKPIKCKVIDVYYDIGCPAYVEPEEIVECGQKLLGAIIELEKQGYRFNLYAMEAYSDERDADVLCVKVKSSDKPLDLKRISFPLTHPAFFRVIGFDWQSKVPFAKWRGSGRGQALTTALSLDDAKEMVKQTFGDNAIYIACNKIRTKDEDYMRKVLVV